MNKPIKGWDEAYYVKEFLLTHCYSLVEITRRRYTNQLSAFITYACKMFHCAPLALDFSTATTIYIEDEAIYDQVERNFIEGFLATLKYPTNREQAARVLRAYFSYLLDAGYIRYNPVPPRKKQSQRHPKKRSVDIADYETLVRYLRTQDTPCAYALLIQGGAGLRIGEVLALRVEDVYQQKNGQWVIDIQRPDSNKSKRAFRLPLPNAGGVMGDWMTWRKRYRITSDYLFVNKANQKLSINKIREYLQKSCRQLGLPVFQTHDLRRGYATLMDGYVDNQAILTQALHQAPSNDIVTGRYVASVPLSKVDEALSRLNVTHLSAELAANLQQGTLYEFPDL